MRPGDRVIVDCPNYEDYKAIVSECDSAWVKVCWVDNTTWKPLDEKIHKPTWKRISKVKPWKPVRRTESSDEDYDDDEDDENSGDEDDDESEDDGGEKDGMAPSFERQRVGLDYLKYLIDDMKTEIIDFGMSSNRIRYKDKKTTFDVVSKTDIPFLKYATMVVSGQKPLNDDGIKQAKKYIEFCRLKDELRRRICSDVH